MKWASLFIFILLFSSLSLAQNATETGTVNTTVVTNTTTTVVITALNLENATNILTFAQQYTYALPDLIMQGDVGAMIIGSILFFIVVAVIQKISDVLLKILKKTLIFIIIGLAVYYFMSLFFQRLSVTGYTLNTMLFGVSGLLIGAVGIALAFFSLMRNLKGAYKGGYKKLPEAKEIAKGLQEETPINLGSIKEELLKELSLQSLKTEKSLLSVVVYLVIAQFGVFSSVTISAPNPMVGFTLFLTFIFAALVFIKQIYNNYRTGIIHLFFTVIFGFILSIVLGYFWGGYPLSALLSMEYFRSSSLIALITGIALALFMTSK
jgi:hypothetical protein